MDYGNLWLRGYLDGLQGQGRRVSYPLPLLAWRAYQAGLLAAQMERRAYVSDYATGQCVA